jgi:cytochrome d ubiquinol oxidase subunit II
VWESNHVWLVIVLVLLWTAFPQAFGALMSTEFIPLSAAAFGIILRGSGFALRSAAHSLRHQRLAGASFALSSLITPFFFGAVAGAIVTGEVPASGAAGRVASWTSPTAITLGFLSVAAFGYLAAVYLTHDAERIEPALISYFRHRAIASGIVVGALAGLALYELETSATSVAHRLLGGVGLPFLIGSFLLGSAVLVGLVSGRTRWLRYLAAGAFVAVLWGWGIAQYPAMLPGAFTLQSAAAPSAALLTEVVIVGFIIAVVVPSFWLLYRLAQRGILEEEGTTERYLIQLQRGEARGPGDLPGKASGSRRNRGRRHFPTSS